MRSISFAGTLVSLVLFSLCTAPSAGGQGIALTLHPDTVVLADTTGEAWLVVRNAGQQPAERLSFALLAPGPLSVTPVDPLPAALAPGAEAAVRLRVGGAARVGGERVLIRGAYRAGAVDQTVTGSLFVRPRTRLAADSVIAVQLYAPAGRLRDGMHATLHLLVTNRLDTPVRVTPQPARGPDFIHFDTAAAAVEIGPRGEELLPITVRVANRVQPGKHLLIFPVRVAWTGRDGAGEATRFVTHEAEIGVLGESDILLALAVPSFLLLPGFLVVAVFGIVWKAFGRDAGILSDAKSKTFWVAAITMSLLMAVMYPLVGHDYLQGYGARDVARIWMVSALAGSVLAAFVHFGDRLHARVQTQNRERVEAERARQEIERTPALGDTPLQALRKLHLRGVKGIRLKTARKEGAGDVSLGFRLTELNGDGGAWVAPAVVYRWADRAGAGQRAAFARLLDEGDFGAIADEAERLVRGRDIEALVWDDGGASDGVVFEAGLEDRPGDAPYVVEG
jgi:hypothetical protein